MREARLEKRRQQARARKAAKTAEARNALLDKRRQQARARNAARTAEARNALLERRRQQAKERDPPTYSHDTPAVRQIKRGVAAECWNIFILQTEQKVE